MPELTTLLRTENPIDHPAMDRVIIDTALKDGESVKAHKIDCIANSPFRQTLFLDTDTRVLGRVDELFELLEAFDLAVAHDPTRLYFGDGEYPGKKKYPSNIPRSFPEMNTGVMVYDSQSPATQSLFRAWQQRYKEMQALGVKRDQISFREVLYENNVRMTVLTPEYNCRSRFPVFLEAPVKIYHARHSDPILAERVLNETVLRRTRQPWMFEVNLTERLRGFYHHIRQMVSVFILPWKIRQKGTEDIPV